MRTNPISTSLLQHADIQWDRDGQPRSREFGDIYFSSVDPWNESLQVFIHGNNLPARMANTGPKPLVIGECGFGFGLNFLLTCEHFCRLAPVNARLHYISCERFPVKRKDLQRFYAQLPASLLALSGVLLGRYPEQGKGLHRLHFSNRKRHITLDLVYDDATQAFQAISQPETGIDAWYLDGFAPDRNRDMWHDRLCQLLAANSHHDTTLATYSVAGYARRNLEAAGFNVSKVAGYGNKRHRLTGTFAGSPQQHKATRESWANPWPPQQTPITSVAVIGAGLAGCATAHALACRRHAVTLIEKNAGVGSASSGNPRGIVHFSPSLRLTPATRFRLQAFTHAVRHYQELSARHDFSWRPCGVVQLAVTEKELQHQQALVSANLYDPALIQGVTAKKIATMAGMEITHAGIFLPGAGSLSPVDLCRAWTDHANITLKTGTEAIDLAFDGRHWHVSLAGAGPVQAQAFDALVICNNQDARQSDVLPAYPCQANHGQTDTYYLQDNATVPDTILCHQGYIVPWRQQGKARVMIGGSYAQGRHLQEQIPELAAKNLALLKKFAPGMHTALATQHNKVSSRAGTRITTPDYLPLAGPVENTAICRAIFAGFRRNARKQIHARGDYLPGLFVNLAHGSSGLTTIPLLADYLASLISAEYLPLLQDDIQAIHPLRFLIRDLKRQKTR